MEGHRLALFGAERLGDPAHLLMVAAPIGIGVELALKIAGVQSRQSRGAGAIAAAVQPVTGEACVTRPSLGAAHGDDPPVGREPVKRAGVALGTAAEQARDGKEDIAHRTATTRRLRLFRHAASASLMLLAAACKPPPDQRRAMPVADAAHGKDVIKRVGCGSCHAIPGVRWPQGTVGPRLDGLSDRALIAGKLANRPDLVAAYIRNAPALVPGSAMPAMPLTEAEARDVAAYLYEQGAR